MKIFEKKIKRQNDKLIKTYAFLNLPILIKEKTPCNKTWKIMGIPVSLKTRQAIQLKLTEEGECPKDIKTIIASDLFDREWYTHYYYEIKTKNINPAWYYLLHSQEHNPSPEFYTKEYLMMYPEAAQSKLAPLVNYEQKGRAENRAISFADLPLDEFTLKDIIDYNQSLMPRNKISKYMLRQHYAESLEKIVSKSKTSGNKIKITFLVNAASMFPAKSLLNKIIKDKNLTPALVVIPDTRFGAEQMYREFNETYQELSKEYPDIIEKAVEFDDKMQIIKWRNIIKQTDIVVYPLPYDISYSIYNPSYAIRTGRLSIFLNYGFPNTKYSREVYQMDIFNDFWITIAETPTGYEEYYTYGYSQAANALLCGYAKMDTLVELMEQVRPKNRKKIIIAPHHSIAGGFNNMMATSNFEQYADLFLELPKLYPEIDFIFRPHPALFICLRRSNFWGNEKVDAYLKKMTSFPNMTYDNNGDYMQTFAESDGMIEDCGSFLTEYFYTGKPQCYMLKTPEDITEKFSKFGADCLNHCYLAYKRQDIIDFIDNVIVAGKDTMLQERKRFAEQEIMINYPNAGDLFLKKLKKYLQIED